MESNLRRSRKKLSWRRRTSEFAISSKYRVVCKKIEAIIVEVAVLVAQLKFESMFTLEEPTLLVELKKLFVKLILARRGVLYTDKNLFSTALPKKERKHTRIEDLDESIISEYFRFRSRDDLYRLRDGFCLNRIFRAKNGHVYTGDEVLLVGLYSWKIWDVIFHLQHFQSLVSLIIP